MGRKKGKSSNPSTPSTTNRSTVKQETPGVGGLVQCHLCHKPMRRKNLKGHMEVHADKTIHCDEPQCDAVFSSAKALSRHKMTKHMDVSLRPFPCALCYKRFLNNSRLEAHMRTHTGVRDATCGLCFQSFYSKADLVRHMKGIHLNIRSFTCHLCNKGFFRKSHLKEHVSTVHVQMTADEDDDGAAQGSYQCRYCKESFPSRTTWLSHERSHSGTEEQRALCMVCGKTFSRPSSLKKHLEKHNGPPSLKCPYCERPFYHLSSYKRHLYIHNRPDPDICQVCGTVFTNRDAFRRHLRKHVARGDLATLPPPEREEPRLTKMQQLMSKGVDLDEILKSCKVEVVELGGKNNPQNKARERAVDAIIEKAEKNKWILEVDELENSIRHSTRADFEIKSENNWNDLEQHVFTVESLGYHNNKCYTVISNDFKSIVKNNAISNSDWELSSSCFDFHKFTKPCVIFTVNTNSINTSSTELSDSITATDIILHKDVNVELFSTVTEIEIPNYVEQIPEIRTEVFNRDLFQLYETILDEVHIVEVDLAEDVFYVMSSLHRNMADMLRPLQIVPRSLTETPCIIPTVSRSSTVDLEKALDAFDMNTHSTLPKFGINTVTYPRDWSSFRDIRDIVEMTDDELRQQIAQLLSGNTRVFWIKNLDNVSDDAKELNNVVKSATTSTTPVKYEAGDTLGSLDDDHFIYEDLTDVMDYQTDSEPELKPDMNQLGSHVKNEPCESPCETVSKKKKKKRKRAKDETEEPTKAKKPKKKKRTNKEKQAQKEELEEVILEVKQETKKENVIEEMLISTEFECSHCEKIFTSKVLLRKHIRTMHTSEKSFSCHQCGLAFTVKSRLEAHIEYVHLKIRNYQCDKCEWAFYARADLERHERRHSGVKPFMCHLCSKTFVRKAQLKSHIVIHSGERKFMCNMCGKSFATRSTLVTHLKRHSRQPTVRFYKTPGVDKPKRAPGDPILCQQCGKELSTPHSLKRHIELVHEKVNTKPKVQKPFPCPICPSSFGYKTSMQRHMHKTHRRYIEPRTHGCPVCGRRLLNEACVLRHMVKRHPYNCDNIDAMNAAITKALQRNIPCPICKRKFLKETGLQKHMVKKHYYKSDDYDNMIGYPPAPPLVVHPIAPDLYNHLQPPDEKPNLLLL
uniref:Zinc finger protein 585B n=3 Tax=Cacopsylla melanoneura TaxID=428564 RepID=A0A8D8TN88_9HEMI